MEAIRGCLIATAQQKNIPLASFEGIPLPDRATLQPYLKGGDIEEEEESETDDFGNFAAASAAPTQTMAATTPQQGFDAFNGLSGATSAPEMGQNVPSQQPGMGMMPQQHQQQQPSMGMMNQQQQPSMGMMNQQQQPMGMMNQQQQSIGMTQQQTTGPQTTGWGAFDSLSSTAPSEPQSQMQTQSNDFGGFSAATSSMPSAQQAPGSSGWDALNGLANTTPAPAPLAMSAVSSVPQMQTQNDEMGTFGSSMQSAPTASGWDALDALASSTPAPPPPTLPDASPVLPPDNNLPSTMSNATATSADGFGSFASSSQPPPASQSSGWGALDELASSTPDPVPPTLPSGTASVEASQQQMASHTDDEFGDFYYDDEEENRSDVLYAVTDETGRFEANFLPDATYCICVNDARYVSQIIDLIPFVAATNTTTSPRLNVRSGHPVEVTVRDALSSCTALMTPEPIFSQ